MLSQGHPWGMITVCCVPGPLPRAARNLFNLILKIAAIFQMKKRRLHSVALSQRSSLPELCFSLLQLWYDIRRQLRWQEGPCLPNHQRHPFSWEDPPGRWFCFSAAPCMQSFIPSPVMLCQLPLSKPHTDYKAPVWLHTFDRFWAWEEWMPSTFHLLSSFSWTCHIPDHGAITLANKPILVILVGFWQPVIPQPKFYFTLVTASHIQALSTHPASSCQMHLAQQLPVAPHCLSNYGQGLRTNIYNPLCSGTSHFPASLPCFLCTCSQIQLNPPTVLSSKPYKGWPLSPSPFPSLEIPAPPQDSANMLGSPQNLLPELYPDSPSGVGFFQSVWFHVVEFLLQPSQHAALHHSCPCSLPAPSIVHSSFITTQEFHKYHLIYKWFEYSWNFQTKLHPCWENKM